MHPGNSSSTAALWTFNPNVTWWRGQTSPSHPPISRQARSRQGLQPAGQDRERGGVIYNAPMIAFDVEAAQINFPNGNPDYHLVHDQVVKIDPNAGTVTLNLINGFSFGRPLLYISLDSNAPLVAAIEGNTYAPLLGNIALGMTIAFPALSSASSSG